MLILKHIYNNTNTLNVAVNVMSNDDIDKVIVSVSALHEKYEQTIHLGSHELTFDNLVIGRTYDIKVKADIGFGLQVIKEKTYKNE